jgi:hypothetical protein
VSAEGTPGQVWGRKTEERLARWALDALLGPGGPPAKPTTYTTRIRSTLVAEGRAILDDAGFDWAAFHAEQRRIDREHKAERRERADRAVREARTERGV